MQLVRLLEDTIKGAEREDSIFWIVLLFESKGKAMQLLDFIIAQELQAVDMVNTLFRSNTFSSACMKQYSMLVGAKYLRETLRGYVLHLVDVAQDRGAFQPGPPGRQLADLSGTQ